MKRPSFRNAWLLIGPILAFLAGMLWTQLSVSDVSVFQNPMTWGIERKCGILPQSVAVTREQMPFARGKWVLDYPLPIKRQFALGHAKELKGASHFEHAGSIEDIGFYGSPRALVCLTDEMHRRGYEPDVQPRYRSILSRLHSER